MKQVKLMIRGGLATLVLCLVITVTVLVMSEINQRSLAETLAEPLAPALVESDASYTNLTDAPPQRDITAQRFAPLEVSQ